MFSFQNAWPIKIKAVYTLVLFHITVFIHFLVWLWSQLVYFLKLRSYFILVNLQLVAGGKKYCSAGKFYWSLPDKETTTNPKSLWINNVKMTPLQVEKKKELYKNNGENTLLGTGVDSLIQHLSCTSNIKRLTGLIMWRWLHKKWWVQEWAAWFNIWAEVLTWRDCGLIVWRWLHKRWWVLE